MQEMEGSFGGENSQTNPGVGQRQDSWPLQKGSVVSKEREGGGCFPVKETETQSNAVHEPWLDPEDTSVDLGAIAGAWMWNGY